MDGILSGYCASHRSLTFGSHSRIEGNSGLPATHCSALPRTYEPGCPELTKAGHPRLLSSPSCPYAPYRFPIHISYVHNQSAQNLRRESMKLFCGHCEN